MQTLVQKGGKKQILAATVVILVTFFASHAGFSEMRITTHDGKIVKVPVNSKDIKSIEFTREETVLSIEGVWNSSIGFQYRITQSGNAFDWNVITPINEQGKGTITGNSVSASWSGANGSGSTSGRITGTDSQNRANRIEWNNGVVFYR